MEVSRVRLLPLVRVEPATARSRVAPKPIRRMTPVRPGLPPPPPVGAPPGLVLRPPEPTGWPPWLGGTPITDPPPPDPTGDPTVTDDPVDATDEPVEPPDDPVDSTDEPTEDAPPMAAVPEHLRLGYNTALYTVGTPPAGADLEFYESALTEEYGGFSVVGVETETEQLCATRALWFVTWGEASAGRETDLKIEIDGDIRHLTVRVPPEGPPEVVLHPRGSWAPVLELETVEDWSAALEETFAVRMAPPSDESKEWVADELARVYAGFARMSDAERTALCGVVLVRVTELEDDAAGVFSWSSSIGDGVPQRVEQLILDDGAFAGDGVSFVGSGADPIPASVRTIVHEAGHALESAERRDALFARNDAVVMYNDASATYLDDLNRELGGLYRSGPVDEITRLQAFLDATIAVHQSFNALVGESDTALLAERIAAIEAATAARDATVAELAAQDRPGAAAATLLQDAHAPRVVALAETRLELERVNGVERSARLEEFVQLVHGAESAPPTRYADENWPDAPQEFYAEAFALYRTDPEYLAGHRPAIFAWFEGDEHVD